MIKITKSLFEDATVLWDGFDKSFFPQNDEEMDLPDVISEARKAGFPDMAVQHVLWNYDFNAWIVAQMGVCLWEEDGAKAIVDNYLNEQME